MKVLAGAMQMASPLSAVYRRARSADYGKVLFSAGIAWGGLSLSYCLYKEVVRALTSTFSCGLKWEIKSVFPSALIIFTALFVIFSLTRRVRSEKAFLYALFTYATLVNLFAFTFSSGVLAVLNLSTVFIFLLSWAVKASGHLLLRAAEALKNIDIKAHVNDIKESRSVKMLSRLPFGLGRMAARALALVLNLSLKLVDGPIEALKMMSVLAGRDLQGVSSRLIALSLAFFVLSLAMTIANKSTASGQAASIFFFLLSGGLVMKLFNGKSGGEDS